MSPIGGSDVSPGADSTLARMSPLPVANVPDRLSDPGEVHRTCERLHIGGKFAACKGSFSLLWRCSFRWPLLHKRPCPFQPRTEAKFTPMFTEEVTEASCWLTGVVSTRRAG